MSELVFKARGIVKQYKKLCLPAFQWKISNALNGVDMEINRGEIYGFVGGNGAGKTTLIRILAGLVTPTQGKIELFGKGEQQDLYIQRRRMNGIIEIPALNPVLTAQENLEVCRLQRGIVDKKCIEDVLKTAGLEPSELKGLKVKNFSLGMKQRLGIAKALLGEPEFLFFDEPLNGLDPTGIKDFRILIKTLNQSGITVLISSHMLSELDQLATCYGFINKGKMIEQISAEDLENKFSRYMMLKVDNLPLAEKILRQVFGASKFEIVSEDTIHLYEQIDKKGKIMKAFVMKEITVEEMTIKGEDLEEYYMSLIGKKK